MQSLNYDNENKLILPKSTVKRIIKKIIIPEDISKCWEWIGGRAHEYPYIRINNIMNKPVHRIMYELVNGKIEQGLVIDHVCSNKNCVNPQHLEEVTNHENNLRGNTDLQHAGYCKNGHKRTPENTYIRPDGRGTYCRKCADIYHPKREDYIVNKDKTHCIRGHEFTLENTRIRKYGGRQCKTCDILHAKGLI